MGNIFANLKTLEERYTLVGEETSEVVGVIRNSAFGKEFDGFLMNESLSHINLPLSAELANTPAGTVVHSIKAARYVSNYTDSVKTRITEINF